MQHKCKCIIGDAGCGDEDAPITTFLLMRDHEEINAAWSNLRSNETHFNLKMVIWFGYNKTQQSECYGETDVEVNH